MGRKTKEKFRIDSLKKPENKIMSDVPEKEPVQNPEMIENPDRQTGEKNDPRTVCHICRKKVSNATSNGICAACNTAAKADRPKRAALAQKIMINNFDIDLVKKITRATDAEIEAVIKEFNIKPNRPIKYTCVSCGSKCESLHAKNGKTGICRECCDNESAHTRPIKPSTKIATDARPIYSNNSGAIPAKVVNKQIKDKTVFIKSDGKSTPDNLNFNPKK